MNATSYSILKRAALTVGIIGLLAVVFVLGWRSGYSQSMHNEIVGAIPMHVSLTTQALHSMRQGEQDQAAKQIEAFIRFGLTMYCDEGEPRPSALDYLFDGHSSNSAASALPTLDDRRAHLRDTFSAYRDAFPDALARIFPARGADATERWIQECFKMPSSPR